MSESQSQYLNMLNNYMKKSLIYQVKEHTINQKCGKCEDGDIGSASRNTARQCVHEKGSTVGRVGEVQETRLRLKVEIRVGSGCLPSSGAEAKFRESRKCVMSTGDGCCGLEVAGYCQQMSRGCYGT